MDEHLMNQFAEPVRQATLMIAQDAECDQLRALTVLTARSDDLEQAADETAIAIVAGTIPVLSASSGPDSDEGCQPGPGDRERASQVDRFHEIAIAAAELFDVSELTSPERLEMTADVDRSIVALTAVSDRLDHGLIVDALRRAELAD